MKIGGTIKELRLNRGLTQSGLADLAGTTAANISRIESGKHGAGSDLLNSLAFVLELKVHQLVAMAEGYDFPESPTRLTPEETSLVSNYRILNKEQRFALNNIIEVLIKSGKNS